MSYANGTTHYNLPQTVGSDKRDWSDTNEAFANIDAAIYNNSQSANNASENITALQELTATHTQTLATHTNEISELQNASTSQAGQISALTESLNTTNSNVEDLRNDSEDMITAYNETSATSTHEYAIGDYFIYNNVLYKATASIAAGDTIVPNTNCSATNVTTEIKNIDTGSIDKIEAMITPYNESDSTADNDYATGNYFVWNAKLYKATSAITAGDTLNAGVNCEETNIGRELAREDMYSVTLPVESGETYSEYLSRNFNTIFNLIESSGRAPLCKLEIPATTEAEGAILSISYIASTQISFFCIISTTSVMDITSYTLNPSASSVRRARIAFTGPEIQYADNSSTTALPMTLFY